MRIISQKLQLRLVCACGFKFNKIYNEGQINDKTSDTHTIKFVYVRCPNCDIIDEVNVYYEPNK